MRQDRPERITLSHDGKFYLVFLDYTDERYIYQIPISTVELVTQEDKEGLFHANFSFSSAKLVDRLARPLQEDKTKNAFTS